MCLVLRLLDTEMERALVVADADELDNELLKEVDTGRDQGCGQDLLYDTCPLVGSVIGAFDERLKRGNGRHGPADEGERNLQSLQDQGIFPCARADDTAKEDEAVWEGLGAELRDPDAEPDALDPDKEPGEADSTDLRIRGDGCADDNWNRDQGGDGEDIDEVTGDDGEVDDLVVKLSHACQHRLLVRVTRLSRACLHQLSSAVVSVARRRETRSRWGTLLAVTAVTIALLPSRTGIGFDLGHGDIFEVHVVVVA